MYTILYHKVHELLIELPIHEFTKLIEIMIRNMNHHVNHPFPLYVHRTFV